MQDMHRSYQAGCPDVTHILTGASRTHAWAILIKYTTSLMHSTVNVCMHTLQHFRLIQPASGRLQLDRPAACMHHNVHIVPVHAPFAFIPWV